MSQPFEELLSKLYGLEAAKGMDFKLERVAATLHGLGDPHLQYPVVHIAGTNGKGSVAAFLHAMFCAGGQAAALYTSPHLVHFTERIRVGAAEIEEDQVVQLASEVEHAATGRGVELTFFEFVTVLAFVHFARQRVPIAIVETGLGGRLDATNVVHPTVTVITSIGFDHQEFLGSSLESIASEKAGIIKTAVPLVVGEVPGAARQVIAASAAAQSVAVSWADCDFELRASPNGFRFVGLGAEIEDLRIGLHGVHQQRNAAVAIAAALKLPPGLRPSAAMIRRGIASVRWPGRLEIVHEKPRVILDGAHNPQGIAALIRELPGLVKGRPLHLLFGVMRDKQWPEMVQQLGPLVSAVTITAALPRRSADLDEVAESFAPNTLVQVVERPIDALQQTLRDMPSDDVLLVTGSLFLIGAVYPYFLQQCASHRLFNAPSTLNP